MQSTVGRQSPKFLKQANNQDQSIVESVLNPLEVVITVCFKRSEITVYPSLPTQVDRCVLKVMERAVV